MLLRKKTPSRYCILQFCRIADHLVRSPALLYSTARSVHARRSHAPCPQPAKDLGRHANFFVEGPGEMALTGKADAPADFGERQRRAAQQNLRAADALPDDIAVWRDTEVGSEQAQKMKGADMSDTRQLFQRQGLFKVHVDVVERSLYLPELGRAHRLCLDGQGKQPEDLDEQRSRQGIPVADVLAPRRTLRLLDDRASDIGKQRVPHAKVIQGFDA